MEQQQRAGFVGRIVGHGDGRAIGDVAQVSALAGVDAQGLEVNRTGGNQIGAVVLVEVEQIGQMLEVVRIQIARFQCLVGQDVVGELFDLKLNALLGEEGLDGLENLGMGSGRRADDELDGLGGFSGLALFGLSCISGGRGFDRSLGGRLGRLLRRRAGRQRRNQHKGQQRGKDFLGKLHGFSS